MTQTTLLRREDAPVESTWNREAIYPTWADWDAEYEQALAELPALRTFAGRLGEGPAVLLDWLQTHGVHWRRAMKLYFFAWMAVCVDTADTDAKARLSQATALHGNFEAETALAEVELMQLGETLSVWAETEPQLAVYKQYFANLRRQQIHQRSTEVEALLGLLADSFSGAADTYRELTNADLRVADAVDSQGQHHLVRKAVPSPSGILSADREHRRTAWQNFADSHLAIQNSLASNYLTLVKQQVFLAKVRGYGSVLEMMLAPSNLPVAVFHNVIDTFKTQLPVWHRYWAVKRKALGLDSLHPYDIYAPLTKPAPHVPYRQAVDWIGEALQPLGETYVNVLRRGCLEERWVDYAPTAGKMAGAASTPFGAIPPFIYMSYDESLISASFLAHELGHSLHVYLNPELQPHVYRNFQIMSMSVAETAANFHQAMLRSYLQTIKRHDRLFTLALIDEAMFDFHRQCFLMPMLARFEFAVYRQAEAGQSLTVNDLNQIMADLYAEGYGDTLADDRTRTAITWALFPHLYMPYYTFQYAVGLSAAQALAARVLSGTENAVVDYLAFLRAGSTRYPLDLFKLAGVDMTSPAPVEQAFAALAGFVDRLEELTG